jgi:CRISPR-associated protein Cas2
MLSGYRLMWMMVMFDLPVAAENDRKAAAAFRHFLLDEGFEMAQFSVYLRFCTSPSQSETYLRRVEDALPDGGKVDVLFFTDKQYERIVSFCSRQRERGRRNPSQFVLF